MDHSGFIAQSPSEAHPESMDFLSRAWCDFAVQTLHDDHHHHNNHQLVVQDQPMILLDDHMMMTKIESNTISPNSSLYVRLEQSVKMDGSDAKPLPPWKSNDVKSWIWMQQAMHPELNYNGYFKKKWMSWKTVPFKNVSIKKWVKEIKQRRKEEGRLQKAEVHAAVSVAGVAAALAAMAAETSNDSGGAKEAAMASAAALVAAQCAKVAEAMGAKRDHLASIIGSAITGTSASDIFTLAASAKTSIKGAATLKARTSCNNKINGIAPVLPLEGSHDTDFDFDTCRSALAKAVELGIETPDGDYIRRYVSVVLSSEGKVFLQIRKLGLLKRKKESMIMDLHAELYKDSEAEEKNQTCYLIVLTTSKGMIKLDMGDDYLHYKNWATTINKMLQFSSSISKYGPAF